MGRPSYNPFCVCFNTILRSYGLGIDNSSSDIRCKCSDLRVGSSSCPMCIRCKRHEPMLTFFIRLITGYVRLQLTNPREGYLFVILTFLAEARRCKNS